MLAQVNRIGLTLVVAALSSLASAQTVSLPAPLGPFLVGRLTFRWTDDARPEPMTADPTDHRSLLFHLSYPAGPGGSPAPYVPDLERLRDALRASGALTEAALDGVALVQTHTAVGAPPAGGASFPVLVLSPGNSTNAVFYTALVEDLVSHGYAVAALDHPFDVGAVTLDDGRVAAFASGAWPADPDSGRRVFLERASVRADDMSFVLGRLAALNRDATSTLRGRLDLSRAGAIGHSVGGIAASRACQRDVRFRACLNLDGLNASSPFFAGRGSPDRPFMFLTKESRLADGVTDEFRAARSRSYVVSISGASHDSFTDGPAILEAATGATGDATRITSIVRAVVRAFFDEALLGQLTDLPSLITQADATMTAYGR